MLTADITFDGFGVTDKGRRRSSNEDAFICDAEHGIFLVADGMGGESYGEVASQLTAEHFTRIITPFIVDEDVTIPFEHSNEDTYFQGALAHAVEGANVAVFEYAMEHESHRGMGATLTAAVYDGGLIYVAHIGDSRLYRIVGDCIEQLTEDHTKVQEMVKKNLLSPEEVRNHPQKNIITRCVGRKKKSKPDIFSIEISAEETFLLCSDGLCDMVPDEDISRIVAQSENLERAGRRLVETANQNGGKDNITVVLFRRLPMSGEEHSTP